MITKTTLIYNTLKVIFSKEINCELKPIHPSTEICSIDLIESNRIISAIKECFYVEITKEQWSTFKEFWDIVLMIKEKLKIWEIDSKYSNDIERAMSVCMICTPEFKRMLYYNAEVDEYESEGKLVLKDDPRLLKYLEFMKNAKPI